MSIEDKFKTYNCGIGMVFIVNSRHAELLLKVFKHAQHIGHIV